MVENELKIGPGSRKRMWTLGGTFRFTMTTVWSGKRVKTRSMS